MDVSLIPDLLFTRALGMTIYSPALSIIQPGFAAGQKEKEYVELEYVPNDTTNLYTGNDAPALHQGFLQLTLVWPKGEGIVTPIAVANEIIAYWPKGTVLQGTGFKITVPRKPTHRQPIPDDQWWRVPVLVPYQVIAR